MRGREGKIAALRSEDSAIFFFIHPSACRDPPIRSYLSLNVSLSLLLSFWERSRRGCPPSRSIYRGLISIAPPTRILDLLFSVCIHSRSDPIFPLLSLSLSLVDEGFRGYSSPSLVSRHFFEFASYRLSLYLNVGVV